MPREREARRRSAERPALSDSNGKAPMEPARVRGPTRPASTCPGARRHRWPGPDRCRGPTSARGPTGAKGDAGASSDPAAGRVARPALSPPTPPRPMWTACAFLIVDLTTIGPTTTVTIAASGRVFISLTSVAVARERQFDLVLHVVRRHGATTVAPSNANGLMEQAAAQQRASANAVLIGLTPGSYPAHSQVQGFGRRRCHPAFGNRTIMVIPLP